MLSEIDERKVVKQSQMDCGPETMGATGWNFWGVFMTPFEKGSLKLLEM